MKHIVWQKREWLETCYLIGTNDNILLPRKNTESVLWFPWYKGNYQSYNWLIIISFYEYDSAQWFLPEYVTFLELNH